MAVIFLLFQSLLFSGIPVRADPGFDQRYERDYNIFNPASKHAPDNPLNPAQTFAPDNPFNPVNRYDPGNPVNPTNRYAPNNPFNPANQYNPDNPLNQSLQSHHAVPTPDTFTQQSIALPISVFLIHDLCHQSLSPL